MAWAIGLNCPSAARIHRVSVQAAKAARLLQDGQRLTKEPLQIMGGLEHVPKKPG